MIGNRDTGIPTVLIIHLTSVLGYFHGPALEICLEVNLRKATPAGIREPFCSTQKQDSQNVQNSCDIYDHA